MANESRISILCLEESKLPQDSMDNHWTWYAALYCRELGLCNDTQGGEGWGANNQNPARVADLATYYLRHSEHSRVGKEMILCCMYDSARTALAIGPLSASQDQVLRDATRRAMADVYDRDVVSWYWERVADPQGECHLSLWIKHAFPDWEPPPSIWSSTTE